MKNLKQVLRPVGEYVPTVSPNPTQATIAAWKKEEELYEQGNEPFSTFVSRKEQEPGLPPNSIPNCPIWFQPAKFTFGDTLIDINESQPLSGIVVGMLWDEHEWEYTLLGDMGIAFPAHESDLILFNPDDVQELVVFKHGVQWVFDAPEHGLTKEPFVAGIDTMIDRLTIRLTSPENGFTLRFSHNPFPGYRTQLLWQSPEQGGNWYYCPDFDLKGWLCPALFSYFESAPKKLYVQALPLSC